MNIREAKEQIKNTMKLYFLKDRPEEERAAVIALQKQQCTRWQEIIRKKLEEHPDADDYLHIIYSFRAEFVRSALRWMDTL